MNKDLYYFRKWGAVREQKILPDMKILLKTIEITRDTHINKLGIWSLENRGIT